MEHKQKHKNRKTLEYSACKLILKYVRTTGDVGEASALFGSLLQFSQAAKSIKKYITDAIILDCARYVTYKSRCEFVNRKTRYYIATNNNTGLFEFMNLVVTFIPLREAGRMLTSLLIPITKQFTIVLKEYLSFLEDKGLHISRTAYAESDLHQKIPFPGFTPCQIEQALQIADERNDKNATSLLFEKFLTYFNVVDRADVDPVRAAIEHGQKLNFNAHVARIIQNIWNLPVPSISISTSWLKFYIAPKKLTFEEVESLLHGERPDKSLLKPHPHRMGCLLTFYGADIMVCLLVKSRRRTLVLKYQRWTPDLEFSGHVLAPKKQEDMYIYEFYKALVNNDLQKVKRIQEVSNILNYRENTYIRPNPIAHYFKRAKQYKEEVIDYLCEQGVALTSALCELDRPELVDDLQMRKVIYKYMQKGAKTNSMALIRQLFRADPPRTKREFEIVFNATILYSYNALAHFLVTEFRTISQRYISDIKILLLLDWQFGSGSSLLKTLPFEILKIIIEFVSEPSLVYQFVEMIVKTYLDKKPRSDMDPTQLEFDSKLLDNDPDLKILKKEYPSLIITRPYWRTLYY